MLTAKKESSIFESICEKWLVKSILLALIRNQETRFSTDDIISTGVKDFNSKVYFTETDLQTNHFQIFMLTHIV